MTQGDNWLPTSKHILQLIEHGESLVNGKITKNLSISLILIDNSVELILREYLRYYKGRNPREVENLKFHELLANSSDLQSVATHSMQFQAFHDLRNIIYHSGGVIPSEEDVVSAISFTKELFNELHPEHELTTEIQLPSENTIEKLNEISSGAYSELSAIRKFAQIYEMKGYNVTIEARLGSHYSADLILEKNDHLILCEFKRAAEKVNQRVFGQLLLLKTELEKKKSLSKISSWLIATGSFSEKLKHEAKNVGITLIDDSNMEDFTGENNLFLLSDKSVVMYDDVLTIFTRTDNISKEKIHLKILDQQENIVFETGLDVNDTNWNQAEIKTSGPKWAIEGAEYQIIAEYAGVTSVLSIWRSDFGSVIELDQKVYSWTDKVLITVVAPDLNRDANSIETIGNRLDSQVTISTSRGSLTKYKLVETGKNTGIFVGEITLTGFDHYDVVGGGEEEGPSGKTEGIGPNDGLLACSNEDFVKVTLTTLSQTVTGSALIRWNIGEISFDSQSYKIGDTAVIVLEDPDVNLDPQLIDMLHVKVTSDSDPEGIKVLLIETGSNTGIFSGDLQFGNNSSDYSQLKVAPGDTVSVVYVDRTLPKPYSPGDTLDIGDTAAIRAD